MQLDQMKLLEIRNEIGQVREILFNLEKKFHNLYVEAYYAQDQEQKYGNRSENSGKNPTVPA